MINCHLVAANRASLDTAMEEFMSLTTNALSLTSISPWRRSHGNGWMQTSTVARLSLLPNYQVMLDWDKRVRKSTVKDSLKNVPLLLPLPLSRSSPARVSLPPTPLSFAPISLFLSHIPSLSLSPNLSLSNKRAINSTFLALSLSLNCKEHIQCT